MPIGNTEIGSPPPSPERNNRIESRDSRRDVVNTLKSSVRYLDSDLSNLTAHEDPTNHSDEYKKLSWIRESVVGAYSKTQESGKNKGTFNNGFQEFTKDANGEAVRTGRDISLPEGIPIDDLLLYLQEKSDKLDWKNPKQAKEKQKLINKAHLLYSNSEPFYKVPGRFHTPPTEEDLSVIYSRKHLETNLISKDHRATPNIEDNWKKAEDALARRLELKLPKTVRKPRPEPGTPHNDEKITIESEEGNYDKALKTLRRRKMLVIPLKPTPEPTPIPPHVGEEHPPVPPPPASSPTPSGIPIDQELKNVAEAAEDEEETEGPPPPVQPEKTQIPIDQNLPNIGDAAEDEGEKNDETPVTPSSKLPSTGEDEEIPLTPNPSDAPTTASTTGSIPPSGPAIVTEEPPIDIGKINDETIIPEIPPKEEPTPEPTPIPPHVGEEHPPVPPHEGEGEEEKIVLKSELIGADTLQNKTANLGGIEMTNDFLHSGKLWHAWMWPSKIGIRLGQGGAINWATEKLRCAMTEHNTHLVSLLESVTPEQLAEAKRQAAADRAKIVERFKEGGATSAEQRVLANPEITKLIRDSVIMPITRGEIKDDDQIRKVLAKFVLDNLNNPNPAIRDEIRNLFGADKSDYGTITSYFATDLLEMGKEIKEGLDTHNVRLEEFEAYVENHYDLKIYLGEVAGPFNEDIRTTTDRAVAWFRRRENKSLARGAKGAGWLAGTVFNPLTVGIVTSLGAEGILRGFGWGAKGIGIAAAIPTGGLSLALGIGAGMGVSATRRTVEIGRDANTRGAQVTIGGQIETAEQVRQNIKNSKGWRGSLLRIPNMDRLMGLYRTSDLDELRLNSASTNELLKGGGQEICENGGVRRSAYDILFLLRDHPTDQNLRQEAARRMTEINLRINEGQAKKKDLISYISKDSIYKEQREIQSISKQLQTALKTAVPDQDEFTNLETTASKKWMDALNENVAQMKKKQLIYTAKQAGGAAIFAGTAGAAGGVAVGALKNISEGRNPFEMFGGGRAPGFAVDQTKELYNHPANLQLNKDIILAVSPDAPNYAGRAASLLDINDNKIASVNLADNGHIFVSGDFDKLPDSVKALASGPGWENHPTSSLDFNIKEDIKDMVTTGRHDTFIHGNFFVDMNSGPNGQMSMEDIQTHTRLNGFSHIVNGEPVLDVDSTFAENKQIDPAHFKDLTDKLTKDSWTINQETVPGIATAGNTVDQLLNQPPEVLKARGIIETDQSQKRWSFHVLRPDIVEATGNHTHNELTLHLGGEYQVGVLEGDGQVVPGDLRHGVGNPGELNTGSELHGGAIQSHLSGVSAQEDPVLNNLISRNNGLKMSDTVFVVDLNNGKQIMLPTDAMGNGKLPDELYNHTTGTLYGVDTIATAVIQKADGSVMNPTELFATGKIPDGSIVHSLASERFMPTEPPPVIPTPHDVYHLIPPGATEIIPPPATEAPPIIITPTPFSPRHPLGPPRENGMGTPFYYEMPITDEKRRLFKQNLSPTLKENSQAVLNPQKEVQLYFERQSPEYKQEITNLAEQITTPASPNLEAIVCIPVAGHEEGTHIYETLENYSTQNAPKDQYEILLFVNHPEGTNLDKTVEEIKRFQHDHPEMPVRMIYKQLPMSQAKMAVIRKYLNDVALLRSSSTINRGKDIILISNDADLRGVAPEYISNFIEKFDQNPKTDLMVGQLDWDPASYVEYPVIHAGTRLFQYLNLLVWNGKNGERPSSGANTALRASIYAGVGGYQINDIPGSEDVTLGQAIRVARDTNKTIGYAGTRVSRLYTSSRRAMAAWTAGFAPIEQWDKNWGIINEQIRKLKLGVHQTVDYDDPVVIESVKKDLEKVIQRTLAYYSGTDRSLETPLFKKAVWFLGIKYKINPEGNIEITKMDEFIKGIKRYQKYGVILQQIKSGKLPADALKNLVDEPDETLPQTPPTEAIRTINAEIASYIPTKEELTKTSKWVEKHELGKSLLRRSRTDEEKKEILTNIFRRVESAKKYFELSYPGDLLPVTHADERGIEWVKKVTKQGKIGTQIKSIENALLALNFPPITNFENEMINGLGGKDYARTHRNGAHPDDLDRVLKVLNSKLPDTIPALQTYSTNRVDEIIKATEQGAAAIVQINSDRFVLIPPGQNLNRGMENKKLYVQVIDPANPVREIDYPQLDTLLINSDMVIAEHPSASWALIIERPDLVDSERIPVVTETLPSEGSEAVVDRIPATAPRAAEPIKLHEDLGKTDTLLSETLIASELRINTTLKEIFEKAGKRKAPEVIALINKVESILQEETTLGRGKLGRTIPETTHGPNGKEYFVDGKIAYLPQRGKTIFVGDTHGDSLSTEKIVQKSKFIEAMENGDKDTHLVFLGDYADRGTNDVRNLEIVLGLKERYPNNVILMMGNHEEDGGFSPYELPSSLDKSFGPDADHLLKTYTQLFKQLPNIVITGNGIVAVHAGVPNEKIDNLLTLKNNEKLFKEIRWNDPDAYISSTIKSRRGGSVVDFGEPVFDSFMNQIGGNVMVRAHEYPVEGYELLFHKHLVTIFSNGGTSEESYYNVQPKYLTVSLEDPISEIDPDKNIIGF